MNLPYSAVTQTETIIKRGTDLSAYGWKKHSKLVIINDLEQLITYLSNTKINIFKIDLYKSENILEVIKKLEMNHPNKLKWFNNHNGLTEFVSIYAGKGKAFKYLYSYYQISKKDAIVVGDAPNDLELFEYAANKFAMNNGIQSIIDASTYIIDNSGYLGISRFISNVLNNDAVCKESR